MPLSPNQKDEAKPFGALLLKGQANLSDYESLFLVYHGMDRILRLSNMEFMYADFVNSYHLFPNYWHAFAYLRQRIAKHGAQE